MLVVFCRWRRGHGEEKIPILPIFFHHPLEHPLEDLVELLDEPICLGMVYCGPELFHLQQLTSICLETKGIPWSVRRFFLKPNMGEE